MSKIEVNTVEPQCGTTLTLGGSGDTVTLGSGASQSGFGRTGTVDWITTPKVTGDSPVTGVTGKGYFLNTTAGTITINLPAGAAGSIVSMADYARTWDTYSVTVTPNGSEKIGGNNASATLSTEGQAVTFVYVDSTQGWVNVQDSTSAVAGDTYMTASVSGTCNTLTTVDTNYKIAIFKNPGTFTVCSTSSNPTYNQVSYLVVAGGGGGGGVGPFSGTGGGAGGAGGFRELKSPATPYTASPLDGYPTIANRITVTATPYPIVVGGGGPSSVGCVGVSGSVSSFSTIPSAGGGGGGGVSCVSGQSGGSGGGSTCNTTPGAGNTPPTTPAQGFGGAGYQYGGGGGGATEAGKGQSSPFNKTGGAGASTEITGAAVVRAGGGGGGGAGPPAPVPTCGGAGGSGGGGAGSPTPSGGNATSGTINTGGGGGGGSVADGTTGGAGGSGIVVIRYRFQ